MGKDQDFPICIEVQLLGGRGDGEGQPQYVPAGDVVADPTDFKPADDDIPF